MIRHQSSRDDTHLTLALIASLKSCAQHNDLLKGSSIHIDIARQGLLKHLFVGNTLISMYAKCGALGKAQEVFDELPIRDVVSWNALVTGYAQHGFGEEALSCYDRMQLVGCSPDPCTFACILKACGNVRASDKGQEIHAQILRDHVSDLVVVNALLDMYAKNASMAKAREVFDEFPERDLVSWTALIGGYAQHGHGQEAINCFEKMLSEGFSPNAVTYACILKACGSIGDLNKGQAIHAHIVREHMLEKHVLVANALVDMYVKCGALEKAQEVFDQLPARDVIAWTSLISGYAKHEHGEKALTCFEDMESAGFAPNIVTFSSILKACGSIKALEKGQEVHDRIIESRLLGKDIVLANALVDMYAKCGALEKAQKVFDELPAQDVISWTVLIAGYAEHGHAEEALECFDTMQKKGFSPNDVTFTCILKACGSIGALSRGTEIHAQILKEHVLEDHIMVNNALIDMYGKCGSLEKAEEVFNELPERNVVSWNALITGYTQHGYCEEAINCFSEMQVGGFSPNEVTFACVLKACGSIGASDKGQVIHDQIGRECAIENNLLVSNALLDMHSKHGALEKAQGIFDALVVRDEFSWNTIIAGYTQYESGEEAFSCFERMQAEGISPDAITFACIMRACGRIGAAEKGKKIHAVSVAHVLLEKDTSIGVALVVMYINCGMLVEAQELFDKLPVRDVVLWSVLIEGYAQLGNDESVLNLFDRMMGEGMEPDQVIFTIVLNTCSHGGLLHEGLMYFEWITKDYGKVPTSEHHACMVDLFGRAGDLHKAAVMIEGMPFPPDSPTWHTMLGACQKWLHMELGRWAFDHAVQLDGADTSAYISMSNIYTSAREARLGTQH